MCKPEPSDSSRVIALVQGLPPARVCWDMQGKVKVVASLGCKIVTGEGGRGELLRCQFALLSAGYMGKSLGKIHCAG